MPVYASMRRQSLKPRAYNIDYMSSNIAFKRTRQKAPRRVAPQISLSFALWYD